MCKLYKGYKRERQHPSDILLVLLVPSIHPVPIPITIQPVQAFLILSLYRVTSALQAYQSLLQLLYLHHFSTFLFMYPYPLIVPRTLIHSTPPVVYLGPLLLKCEMHS